MDRTSRPPNQVRRLRKQHFWLLVVATIPWVIAFGYGIAFDVNDDAANIFLFREIFGAGSSDASIFVSSVLTDSLIFLYRLNADIPWYPLLVCVSLGVSQLLFLQLIFAATIATVLRVALLVALTIIVWRLAVFCSFTASALLLSSSALLYGLMLAGSKRIFTKLAIALLLAIGFLLRPGIFPLVVLAFLPAIVAAVLSNRIPLRSAIRYCLSIVSVICVLFTVNLISESAEKKAFKQTNAVRSTFSDLAWGSINPEREAALLAAGWTSADYHVVRYLWWNLDDDVFSTDSLKEFIRANKEVTSLPWTYAKLTASIQELVHLTTLFAILMIAWLCLDKNYRQGWFWAAVLLTLFGVILLAGIRFPARVAYPIVLMLVLAPLAGTSKTGSRGDAMGPLRKTLLISILIPLVWVAWGDIQAHRSKLDTLNLLAHSLDMGLQDLSNGTPGLVLIPLLYRGYSATNFVRPFHWEAPAPALPSGWMAQSPIKYLYLESHGFDPEHKLVPQLLTRKNIVYYFLATKSASNLFVLKPFFNYLNRHYGDGVGASKLTPRILKVEKAGSYYWWFFQIEGVPFTTHAINGLSG